MEESGKRHLATILVVLAAILYFFVCAFPLPKELALAPGWARTIPVPGPDLGPAGALAVQASKAGAELHSYVLPTSFGWFDAEGKGISSSPISFGAAVSDKGFIAYDRMSTVLSLRSPQGKEIAKLAQPGYPFFGGGRLFVVHPGQTSVSEFSGQGKLLWTRDFSSVITAFDASPGLALFGLLDGSLTGLDPSGQVLLSFSPGGSRIAGVYGCAVSPDGLQAAAICGLDRQRLVVLEKRSSAYRVTWHRYLESDFRRPVGIAFTADNRFLVYEKPSGLGIYSRDGRDEASIRSLPLTGLGLASSKRSILMAVEGRGESKTLLCASPSGDRLFSLPFAAPSAWPVFSGDSIFLALGAADGSSGLIRIDFKEE